jgi:hypothetical protein
MSKLRLLIIAIATIFVLTLAAFALVSQPPVAGEDVIVIKGGSLEIQCGKNHGNDCLGTNDNKGKYKHKKANGKIEEIVVKDSYDKTLKTFTRATDFPDGKPSIEITYK